MAPEAGGAPPGPAVAGRAGKGPQEPEGRSQGSPGPAGPGRTRGGAARPQGGAEKLPGRSPGGGRRGGRTAHGTGSWEAAGAASRAEGAMSVDDQPFRGGRGRSQPVPVGLRRSPTCLQTCSGERCRTRDRSPPGETSRTSRTRWTQSNTVVELIRMTTHTPDECAAASQAATSAAFSAGGMLSRWPFRMPHECWPGPDPGR